VAKVVKRVTVVDATVTLELSAEAVATLAALAFFELGGNAAARHEIEEEFTSVFAELYGTSRDDVFYGNRSAAKGENGSYYAERIRDLLPELAA
jgi:hypothetical protein